jgi:hypothetical protein
LEGAVNVSTAVWPEVMDGGTKAAVTPLGMPVTLSAASCVKPLALLSPTAYETVCPMIRLADGGDTARPKVFAGVTVNEELVLTPAAPLLTVMGPVADPAATTKVRDACDALAIGWPMAPPPCFAMDTCGDPKLLPVTVTEVPMGPDFGLKSEIVTVVPESAAQPKFRAASMSIWISIILTAPSLLRSLLAFDRPKA